jgi:hypothetical protein
MGWLTELGDKLLYFFAVILGGAGLIALIIVFIIVILSIWYWWLDIVRRKPHWIFLTFVGGGTIYGLFTERTFSGTFAGAVVGLIFSVILFWLAWRTRPLREA